MALFNRLFQPRKNGKTDSSPDVPLDDDVIPFTFDKTQVRVLLFRECERKGRKLLYDSSDNKHELSQDYDKKKNENSQSNNVRVGENLQYPATIGVQCKLTNSDALLLGEMIFGSVAMNYKGMSLKVHILKSPQRLMCTKVYCNSMRQPRSPNETFASSHASMSTQSDEDLFASRWPSFDSNSHIPVSLSTKDDHLTVNCFINKSDSGFSSQPSSHSSIGYQSSCYELWNKNDELFATDLLSVGNSLHGKIPTCSSSIQWRLTQHYSSTFENQTTLLNIPTKRKDSEVSRSSFSSSVSENLDNSGRCTQRRKIKMGIAIVISLADKSASKMLTFLMDHVILMEGALTRLKHAVHQALCKPELFLYTMTMASHEAAQWLVDLFSCPRIGLPMWSSLSSCNKSLRNGKLADIFMNDLCSLLCTMDTKDTYFFMSSLLTNILTFHLGWVNTVSPYNRTQQKELDAICNSTPYNPLWAQLGEMYGVIGIPSRVSRTIVYGKQNVFLIRKILTVLTYFIRCVNVKRYELEHSPVSWESVDNLINCYQSDNDSKSFMNLCDNKSQASSCHDIEMKTFSSNQHPPCNNVLQCKESCIIESNKEHSNSTLLSSEPTSSQTINCNNESCLSNTSTSSNGDLVVNQEPSGVNSTVKENNSSSSQVKMLSRVPNGGLLCKFMNNTNSGSEVSPYGYTGTLQDCIPDTNEHSSLSPIHKTDTNNVIFILGEDEQLVGLKDSTMSDTTTSLSGGSDFEARVMEQMNETNKSSTTCNVVEQDVPATPHINSWNPTCGPKSCCERTSQCQHSSFKKHSGVKFDFEKYPQIVSNYMKSKNLELLGRHVIGKPGNLKFVECDEMEAAGGSAINVDLPKECDACQNCSFTGQGLQTPSNASELEYTSDIPDHEFQYAKECLVSGSELKIFVKKKLTNTFIVNETATNAVATKESSPQQDESSIVELPLNIGFATSQQQDLPGTGYCSSLLGSVSDHYISDLVLQGGVGGTKRDWEKALSRDLKLQPGATCLLADIDDRSVRVFGGGGGGAGDMSALVASMLDCIPQMCHAKVPPLQCLEFIESKLREMCIRSKGLAQLLIDKDFCDMEYLTKTLNLEPNDVPLLLAIASTHTPQVTLKYGVSYR